MDSQATYRFSVKMQELWSSWSDDDSNVADAFQRAGDALKEASLAMKEYEER